MLSVELKGYKPLSRKLQWIKRNWPRVQRFVMKRMALELVEELAIEDKWVHYIRVKVNSDQIWYGVSVEPDPFEERPDKFPDKLYYLVPTEQADDKIHKLAEGNPYTSDNLPVPLDSDDGIYYLRESSPDERAEVQLRNLIYLDMNGIESAPTDSPQPLQDDIRYNQARGELGIGDGHERPIWRESLKKLIQKRLPEIVDEVTEAMISGRLKDTDLPDFEERPESWLEENEDFMLIAAKV